MFCFGSFAIDLLFVLVIVVLICLSCYLILVGLFVVGWFVLRLVGLIWFGLGSLWLLVWGC